MHAVEQTLTQLLEGQKQYLIPLYQRTYSWKEDQVRKLWDDIVAQSQLLADDDGGTGHFIGSMVLAPTKPVAGGAQRWLVVDGQQRLTTLLLALCALRDHVRTEDESVSDRIHRQHLINEFRPENERAKLVPTQADRDAFNAVLAGHADEASGNIADTYRLFRQLLIGFDDPEDPLDLVYLEQAITIRLDFVAITAEEGDNVHRIFESLNNTGMRLTQGDLLRNYLFMLLPTMGESVYHSSWHPMEKRLGSENIETLAYLDLVVQGYEKAHRSDTYRLQVQRISSFESDEAAVAADIERLARRSQQLERILKPETIADSDLRAAIERLRDWGAEASWPVMLIALERQAAGTASRQQVLSVAAYLESYMVRRMLAGKSSSGINRTLITAANDIDAADDIALALRHFLSSPRRFWPTDSQLTEAIATRNFYWSGKGSQRWFVLKRLEESFGHKESLDWTKAKPSIEHIMPSTPTPEWLADLADPENPDLSPEEVHELYLHRLGNLTLTAYNSDLSNHSFTQKLRYFRDSNIALNREVAEYDSWGPAQIKQRGASLAERSISIWPAPLKLGPPEHEDRWRVVRQIVTALPEGQWTSYGDIAAVAGTAPQPLGNFLAGSSLPNAWRVLTSTGRLSEGFTWPDDRDEDPQAVLTQEGINFDVSGQADPSQRLAPRDLAMLIGLDAGDDPEESDDPQQAERSDRFWFQLRAYNTDRVVGAIESLAETWRSLGGTFSFGKSAQTSMFFIINGPDGQRLWPWRVYPRESIEISFQSLKNQPPFDSTQVREEMRTQLNQMPGIRIDPVRISLRPQLELTVLENPETAAGLLEVAEWFARRVRAGE